MLNTNGFTSRHDASILRIIVGGALEHVSTSRSTLDLGSVKARATCRASVAVEPGNVSARHFGLVRHLRRRLLTSSGALVENDGSNDDENERVHRQLNLRLCEVKKRRNFG
jgi:hypothetical protein